MGDHPGCVDAAVSWESAWGGRVLSSVICLVTTAHREVTAHEGAGGEDRISAPGPLVRPISLSEASTGRVLSGRTCL